MDIGRDNKSTCKDISSVKSNFNNHKNQVINSNNDDNKNSNTNNKNKLKNITSKKITAEEEK